MEQQNQLVYDNFHIKGSTCRLHQYIQDCLLFDNEPIDWYFIRNQVSSADIADRICADAIKYLNLTVMKEGEEYIPDCLGG